MLKKLSTVSFLSGSLLFLFFGFFSFLVDKNLFRQLDFNFTVRLQDNIPRRVDGIFSFFSEVGSFEVMLIVLVALIVFFFFTKRYWAGVVAFVCFGIFHLIELFGKAVVEQLPPPHFLLRTEQLLDFPQFHIRQEYAYPSGHSGRAFFFSTILVILVLQNKHLSPVVKVILIGVILGYDLVMVVSRVYLGEHWVTDVIGGAMLGVALGLITGTFIIKKGKVNKIKEDR